MKSEVMKNKIRVVLVGAGRTGKEVRRRIESTENMELLAVVTQQEESENSIASLQQLKQAPDVIIDFSKTERLEEILEYAQEHHIPLVLGTTGYGDSQKEKIIAASEKLPIVYTSNFSLGITILKQILSQITPILKEEFDIEVEEMHHSGKLDAPSGTTNMLLETLNQGNEYELIYGRNGNKKRGKEIGVHSLRGGTIAGQHNIIYAGEDEILQISHQAHSNTIFAKGAVRAAEFISSQKSGLYDMNDVLFERDKG